MIALPSCIVVLYEAKKTFTSQSWSNIKNNFQNKRLPKMCIPSVVGVCVSSTCFLLSGRPSSVQAQIWL